MRKELTPEKMKKNSKVFIVGGIIILLFSFIGLTADIFFFLFTVLGIAFIYSGIRSIKNLSANSNGLSAVNKSVEEKEIQIVNVPDSVVENTVIKSLNFKVAGVTFKTGRKSRQVMLKNMYFKNTPPFDEGIEITFERYDYDGELAIGVYSNGLQIGNVPKDIVPKFNEYWTSDYNVSYDVYEGKKSVWGCEVSVVFS